MSATKKRENVGILKKKTGGGGCLPKSHFFCNLACQIHSEVLKHVLQWGEVLSDQFDHFKLILFWIPECSFCKEI